MGINLKKYEVGQQSLEKRGLIPNLTTPSDPYLLPSLPPEISQLLMPHNSKLGLEYYGFLFRIWLAQPFFPLRVNTFRESLHLGNYPNLSRDKFWEMVDTLVDHKVIVLRYGRKSHYFDAAILRHIGGQTPHVDWKKIRHIGGQTPHVSLVPHRGLNPPCEKPHEGVDPPCEVTSGVSGSVVVVDFKNNSNNERIPNPDTVRQALAGDAWDVMTNLIPGFQAGHLIPHLIDAHVFCPENPPLRLRGAVFYLADSIQRGLKPRSPLALLRKYIQEGLVLDSVPDLTKKAPSNAKTKKIEPDLKLESEHRDLLNKYALKSFDEVVAEITAHPLWRDRKKTLLKDYELLLQKNICLGEFRAWAEKVAI